MKPTSGARRVESQRIAVWVLVTRSAWSALSVVPSYDPIYFRRMLAAEAVDCLQADVSRCGGITEWQRVAALAAAHGVEISGHCAPILHSPSLRRPPICGIWSGFMTMSGWVAVAAGGVIRLDLTSRGHGMAFRSDVAERYRVA